MLPLGAPILRFCLGRQFLDLPLLVRLLRLRLLWLCFWLSEVEVVVPLPKDVPFAFFDPFFLFVWCRPRLCDELVDLPRAGSKLCPDDTVEASESELSEKEEN